MKKFFCLFLTLCLLLPVVPVCASEVAPLTVDEVHSFLETLRENAMADENVTVVPGGDGAYTATFDGGVLFLADDALRAESAIVGAQLSGGQMDLRGLVTDFQESEMSQGATLEDVLLAYPCLNGDLYGTYEEAVVVLDGDLPGQAMAGVAVRQGQKVETVTYYAYETVDGETVCAEVVYHFSENRLQHVVVKSAHGVENAENEMGRWALLQEEMDYRAYRVSEEGGALEVFVREDLTFSGLDFLSMTAEDIMERFGDPVKDNFLQDADGSYIRTCLWDGIELTMKYDSSKAFEQVVMLYVTTPLLEGPRAVKVGDTLTSLLFRFRHGDGAYQDGATVLYGAKDQAPYGELRYEEQGAYLTYIAQGAEGDVALYLNCADMTLNSYMLAVLENE